MMASHFGHVEVVDKLLQHGATVDLQSELTGYTALMFACKGGHLDTVIGLMEHGADAKIRNVEGITASDVASANEFWDLCAVIELMEPQATADITESRR
ncbi:Ankyrin repeat, SAM and basic leucine zipper domain-containing protein 1 [Geodia barretti]|uniref:Ankyrin repeat, SAM and basic leucine zipper domain-containing protein 1 n=1 Tax=Geodia barretti TaxID=519541 RepID=A0AA35RNN0_GEOBA|nr:Ankyrin repeat, SAM and basic leucine zipper domain-containing protein 1 [Geodia barretti]